MSMKSPSGRHGEWEGVIGNVNLLIHTGMYWTTLKYVHVLSKWVFSAVWNSVHISRTVSKIVLINEENYNDSHLSLFRWVLKNRNFPPCVAWNVVLVKSHWVLILHYATHTHTHTHHFPLKFKTFVYGANTGIWRHATEKAVGKNVNNWLCRVMHWFSLFDHPSGVHSLWDFSN